MRCRNDNPLKKICNSFQPGEFHSVNSGNSILNNPKNEKPMKTTITAVTVALATASFAFGEPPKGKGERGGDRPVPPEVLEKFDANKDGKLDKEERRAAYEARRAEMIKKHDKDGDGKLNDEERKAAFEARKAEMLKRFDKDGDGKLSKEEREAMPKRGPRGPRGEGKGKGGKGEGKGKGKGGKKGGKKGDS